LLACDPNSVAPLCDGLRRATGTVLTVVGEIEAGGTVVTFLDRAGHPVRVGAGYEHFRAYPHRARAFPCLAAPSSRWRAPRGWGSALRPSPARGRPFFLLGRARS